MARVLTIIRNGQNVFAIERSRGIPGHRRAILDAFESRLNEELGLAGDKGAGERTEWVVQELLSALDAQEKAKIEMLSTYLSYRTPDLCSISITENGETVGVELVMDSE